MSFWAKSKLLSSNEVIFTIVKTLTHHRVLITITAEPRDQVYNDPELYSRAMDELKRREDVNIIRVDVKVMEKGS